MRPTLLLTALPALPQLRPSSVKGAVRKGMRML